MRIPGAPGRFTGGGGDDDDETDSTPDSGLGGSIPGAPSGGSDPEPEPDPDPAPEPEPEPDPDPSGFRDDLGGDPVDSGGRNTGGSTRPDPEPDPSPTSRASVDVDVPAGASDGGPIGERVTSNLAELGEIYTERVAEPVGDVAAATNPVAELERRTLGSDRVAEFSEGVGEGVAQIGNIPGNTAAGIDAAQALGRARARSRDQVTIGGVPTGVSVPNPEGQRQNAQAAAGIAASSAASAAENPFETSGRVIGGAVGGALGGAAIARGARGVSRAADAPDAPDTPDGTVPSGRSNPGTEGSGSLLEDVDVDARRGTSGPSTRSRIEGEVSRTVDDVRERVGGFLDEGGTDRGQLQAGGQGRGTGDSDFGDAPDRTRPADAGGSFEDVRQDALTEAQDQLRSDATRPNPGTFDGAPRPFRSGGGDTIDPDGGVSLQRGAGVVDDVDAAAGSSTAGSGLGTGTGTGLGSISSAADPSGIADTGTAAGARLDPAQILGAGTDSTGAGAQSEVLDELGAGRLGGGTLPGDATGTGTDTDSGTDTFSPTDTGSDTGSEPGTDTPTDTATTTADVLATTTLTGTTTDTDTATTDGALAGSPTLGGGATTTDAIARLGGGGGGGSGPTPRPRGEEEPEQDDDAAPLLGFATASREFGSGIASASDFLGGDGARDPFSL